MNDLRIFEKGFLEGDHQCPVCGTKEQRRVMLIPIAGTQKENKDGLELSQVVQVHTDCLASGMWYYPAEKVIVAQTNHKSFKVDYTKEPKEAKIIQLNPGKDVKPIESKE